MKLVHVFLLFVVLLLSACGGDSDNQASEAPGEQTLTPVNLPPSISGEPANAVGYNEEYFFQPQVNDDGKSDLTFSVENKPGWCSFNTADGRLTGLPFSTEVGLYQDVIISVSDGVNSAKLAAFSILVTEGVNLQLSGDAELVSIVDNEYVFAPQLSISADADSNSVHYTISNKPSWMVFDTDSGRLSGTPGGEDIGWFKNIGISAHYQGYSANVPLFDIEVRKRTAFVTSKQVILPNYGVTAPAKGEKRIDAITGAQLIRLTDANELEGSKDSLIVYSRYSPENISGDSILVFGANSTSSWVVNPASGQVTVKLVDDKGAGIGEVNEIRWHGVKDHPKRIYYVKGMQLWMIDDVSRQQETRKLIKDFSSFFPNSSKIYNDVEGDSSNDSDHWAWMAVHYGESDSGSKTFLVDAIVHYQISTDQVHSLTPADLAGSNLDLEKNRTSFRYRANMVEISPLGSGVVIHMGRMWDDSAYNGTKKLYIGSWFDGPHLWPVDFDYEKSAPVKISVDATHSGWSFDNNGQEVFISQNNRTDKLDSIIITGDGAGYDNRLEVASHKDFGWAMGFHYGKLPPTKSGWLFMSTYSKVNDLWASNQLMMIQLAPESQTPVIWRIAPAYNIYNGDYRDEAPAAVNFSGNRIYFSSNWGGMLDHREVFLINLPEDWHLSLRSP